jgi:hypothetical protein
MALTLRLIVTARIEGRLDATLSRSARLARRQPLTRSPIRHSECRPLSPRFHRRGKRDRITVAILFSAPRSEHSARAETLDMQEAAGSNPAPPTNHEFVLRTAIERRISQDSATTALSDRLTDTCGFPVGRGEAQHSRAGQLPRLSLTACCRFAPARQWHSVTDSNRSTSRSVGALPARSTRRLRVRPG